MIGDEILIEIDRALDQLIQNAEVIQQTDLQDLSETEIEAFQKTQESLLHHFLHLDQKLAVKRKQQPASYKIKLGHFEKLKSVYHKKIEKRQAVSLLSKRKRKRHLLPIFR